MKEVIGLFVVVLTSLMGRADGIEPNSGYCIGNQCFTVFQDPSDFTTAQNQCKDQGGHLMTIRSSVSHDILLILLGNFTLRFWIGLHLPTGCPDAAADLKGFQWVTKDSESDFFNWAPSFDSSCSSHRCVSVSKNDEFKWIQEPCGERAAGFLCEYSFSEPCKRLAVSDGESVTYWTTLGFGGEDVLSLPPGSIALRRPAETKYVCLSEQWQQAPWSCDIQKGGCDYKCAVDPKQGPSCYCPPGQAVNPANKVTCVVATEDPCLPLRCAHACNKSGDSYKCVCDHGFKLAQDGRSCLALNDCMDKRQCPRENFVCVNTVGGFQCVCKDGYTMFGGMCVDEDECMSAPCEHICDNTAGSYKCSCYEGYKEDPKSPNKCTLYCGEEECVAECDPNDSFQCYCPEGYVSEEREHGTFCIDFDECSSDYCDQNCQNTFGSYVCTCSPGYTLVGQFTCVKNEDGTVTEGTGAATTPNIPTTPPVPYPDPTRQPSGVTVGGLVGIIVCTAFFIVLLVFLAHHFLSGRGKMESAGALKAPEDEAYDLQQVTSDTKEKPPQRDI
ncbi:thrombomodulin-like [Siniperca chuatsi]|uniref:thrombomodulin-like n=1 Tax=Siniperca chuatsi TaxID=119488 RepID=UPI001CE22943|nr:thrombomodulin-like [Siniperca chuatsi]